MFDVETLGVESTAVVLSIGIIQFEENNKFTFDQLVEGACFVKFNVEEQLRKYKRSTTKSTLEWWAKQAEIPKRKSFIPNKELDLSLEDGLKKIESYIEFLEGVSNKPKFWQRGNLDQSCYDSLYRSLGKEPLIPYNDWFDVRTALTFLYDETKFGYRPLKNFDPFAHVIKHDPVHDCAYDILQLTSI